MAQVDLTLHLPEDHPLTTQQIRHLLAITGEALSNTARHANAHHVQLSVKTEADTLRLTVADDGQGIPLDYVAGYGLRNMVDRARLLEGELEINSQPGQGTRLQLITPWGRHANEKNHPVIS
jgi:signal transduction histidine kinase